MPTMDSHGSCKNSQDSAASCKLLPLGRLTCWMLKLVNLSLLQKFRGGAFHQVEFAHNNKKERRSYPTPEYSCLHLSVLNPF